MRCCLRCACFLGNVIFFGGGGGGSSSSSSVSSSTPGSTNIGSGGGCSITFGLLRLPGGRPLFLGAGGSCGLSKSSCVVVISRVSVGCSGEAASSSGICSATISIIHYQ